jgi:hypothetical protein
MRPVSITVTAEKAAGTYLSRSYPSSDYDSNGMIELYKTPLYKVLIEGTTADGGKVTKVWSAIRFAPYYNDPTQPDPHYRARGWVNAGLHQLAKKAVTAYNPHYGTVNTVSPYSGSIQLRDHFLIHAGPETVANSGWGSAGCVEIIGNFTKFKADIADMSGSHETTVDQKISDLVRARRLFVEVKYATPPDFRKLLSHEEHYESA